MSNIFERLEQAKNESKRVECLKDDMQLLTTEIEEIKQNMHALFSKFDELQDKLNGKLYEMKNKMSRDIEDVKKICNTEDKTHLIFEECDKKYIDIEKYEKEQELLKMAFETYIKNAPSKMTNADYEQRLKRLELGNRVNVVKAFK